VTCTGNPELKLFEAGGFRASLTCDAKTGFDFHEALRTRLKVRRQGVPKPSSISQVLLVPSAGIRAAPLHQELPDCVDEALTVTGLLRALIRMDRLGNAAGGSSVEDDGYASEESIYYHSEDEE